MRAPNDTDNSSPTAQRVLLISWLIATGFCLWFEGSRVLQLADTPAGVLAWFSIWNADTTLPMLVLTGLPLSLLLFPRRRLIRRAGRWRNLMSSCSGYPVTIGLSLISILMSSVIGLRPVTVPSLTTVSGREEQMRFFQLPPAYHDEYSYLIQARTFLAGRTAWPEMTVAGDVFHQIHVLNRPVTASRYFPWTGLWMAGFTAAGLPIVGHWLAGALACGVFHRSLRRLYRPGIADTGGLLIALSPGLAIFSNLLLAHHPTLLALSIFLLAFLQFMEQGHWSRAFLAGTALTLAMLGRPMTAAGFGFPFGTWFLWHIATGLHHEARRRTLLSMLAMGVPLLMGFCVLSWMNQRMTGHWNESAYQYYTDTWTPRHRYGFGNGTEVSPQASVLKKYDQWAENLTPGLAVRNVGNRLLASSVWSMGLVGLLFLIPSGLYFCVSRERGTTGLRLVAAAILSLHVAHIPYWYDGILHWHYVMETCPLLLILAAGGLQNTLDVLTTFIRRTVAMAWITLFLAVVLIPNWLDVEFLWGTSRITQAIQEQSFSRVRYELFRRLAESPAVQHPCLILVDERKSDPQLSYIVNPPDYWGNVLTCRYPEESAGLQKLREAFPDRTLYVFDPETFSLTAAAR